MISHLDKQFCARRALVSADPPLYSDPTKYMNNPDMVSYEMKGRVTRNAMGPLDRVALLQFYIEQMPGLKSLWDQAVKVWVREHTASAVRLVGIRREAGGALVFRTSNDMYHFFNMHVAGEIGCLVSCPCLKRCDQLTCKNELPAPGAGSGFLVYV